MTLAEVDKPIYSFRKEFDMLVSILPGCEGKDCKTCPLHLPYNVILKNHMDIGCVLSLLCYLNKDLPDICTECGHVITRKPK